MKKKQLEARVQALEQRTDALVNVAAALSELVSMLHPESRIAHGLKSSFGRSPQEPEVREEEEPEEVG